MQKGSDSGMAHEERHTASHRNGSSYTDCLPKFSTFFSTRSPPSTFMDCHNIRKYSLIRKLSNKLITLLCVVCLHLYFCTYLYILLSIYGCCCYGSNSLFMCYSAYARQKELADSSGKAEAWNLCISAVCIVSTTYGKGGRFVTKCPNLVYLLCTRPHFWKIFSFKIETFIFPVFAFVFDAAFEQTIRYIWIVLCIKI